MKQYINRAISIFAALVIVLQVTSCNLIRSGANEYNDLVALVQGVQASASNFQLVTDTPVSYTHLTLPTIYSV